MTTNEEIFEECAEDEAISNETIMKMMEYARTDERSSKEVYVDDNKLIGEFDAKVWAEEFVKKIKEKPEIATDEGTMIGWFANAIMAGYDKRANEEEPDKFHEVQRRNKAGSEMDERWCPWKKDMCRR